MSLDKSKRFSARSYAEARVCELIRNQGWRHQRCTHRWPRMDAQSRAMRSACMIYQASRPIPLSLLMKNFSASFTL